MQIALLRDVIKRRASLSAVVFQRTSVNFVLCTLMRKILLCPSPIFTKIPLIQQHYLYIPYIEFRSSLTKSVGYSFICGPGSSVGIVTDYGLEGSGSNSGGDEISRPSRPALGPNQPPLQWVQGLSRG